MHDAGKCVHDFAVHEHVELHELVRAVAGVLVVHRAVAARDALHLVHEIHEDFIQREIHAEHDAARVKRLGVIYEAALVHDELEHGRNVFVRDHDEAAHDGLARLGDDGRVGEVFGIVHAQHFAVRLHDFVNDGGIRGDDVHAILAPQPLDDDLHVQQAEESAAETEAERDGRFRHKVKRGVVELELAHRGLEVLEVRRVDRVDAAEDHRLEFLESLERLGRRQARARERVADFHLGDGLHVRDDVADIAGPEFILRHKFGSLRAEDADLFYLVGTVRRHEAHHVASLDRAVHDAHVHDHAAIRVEGRIEHECAQALVAVIRRRWDACDDGLEDVLDADALLRAREDRLLGGDGQNFLKLPHHGREIGVWKVNFVDHRDELELLLLGEVDIRDGLRLDALRGVHDEERALARGERARDFIREVHVARRVHEVELVLFSVARLVHHAHGVRLDRDAALAFEIHRVEELLLRFTFLNRPGEFEQTIRQRRLAVVNVGDDAEIACVARHGVSFGKKRGRNMRGLAGCVNDSRAGHFFRILRRSQICSCASRRPRAEIGLRAGKIWAQATQPQARAFGRQRA